MQTANKPLSQNNRAYQIYALVDPRDQLVHYVGISINVQVRYYEHLMIKNHSRARKSWIEELRQQSMSPILKILETIEVSDNSHSIACERELYWIQEMARLGHPLLNVLGLTRNYTPANSYRN